MSSLVSDASSESTQLFLGESGKFPGMGREMDTWLLRSDTKRRDLEYFFSAGPTRLVETPHLMLLKLPANDFIPVGDGASGLPLRRVNRDRARKIREKIDAVSREYSSDTPPPGPSHRRPKTAFSTRRLLATGEEELQRSIEEERVRSASGTPWAPAPGSRVKTSPIVPLQSSLTPKWKHGFAVSPPQQKQAEVQAAQVEVSVASFSSDGRWRRPQTGHADRKSVASSTPASSEAIKNQLASLSRSLASEREERVRITSELEQTKTSLELINQVLLKSKRNKFSLQPFRTGSVAPRSEDRADEPV